MGVFFALLASVCWGIYNLLVRRGREKMDPGAGYLLTLIINVLANASFTLLPLPGGPPQGGSDRAIAFFALAGLTTTLLGRTLYFESIFRVGPSRASAWKNASPLYTLIMASVLLGERPSGRVTAGILVTLAGMFALAREQMSSERAGALAAAGGGGRFQVGASSRAGTGLWLGIASGLAFASGIMLRKAGLNLWPDPALGNAVGAAAAFLGWLPFSAWRGETRSLRRTPARAMASFLLAGGASSAAQLLMFLSLRTTPSAVTHAVSSLEPVFTLMLSPLLLGARESLTRAAAAAVAVISAGVLLVGT